jgi:hypothetical protein
VIDSPIFVALTGAAGGLTASVVAVTAGDLLGEQPSISLIVGIAVVAAIGSAVLLLAKKWLEDLFAKMVDSPTRLEIRGWVDGLSAQASGHYSILKEDIEKTRNEVSEVRTVFMRDLQNTKDRVTNIEARHTALDQFRRRSTDHQGE